MRQNQRQANELRPLDIQRGYTKHSAGSVLISCGDTKVLCTASIDNFVPGFLRDTGSGWLTAEYSLLPGSTHTRVRRELSKGKPSGRTSEIQRLIGRALRASIDLKTLGERTICIDCDVLQADGGTRTTAITGAMIALWDAVQTLIAKGDLKENPIHTLVAASSVGKFKGEMLLDLCYEEDSQADFDMNIVITSEGQLVEVQGTAENDLFTRDELNQGIDLVEAGLAPVFETMKNLDAVPVG